MNKKQFRKNNHYLSQSYMENFASSQSKIFLYRNLVSNQSVPLWTEKSIRGIAYHKHLYTRLVTGEETDEIEKWIDKEFEAPAEDALSKAVSDARMNPQDWINLARLLAVHDVRTPARFLQNLERWKRSFPEYLDKNVGKAVRELSEAMTSGNAIPEANNPISKDLPFYVKIHDGPEKKGHIVKASILPGRDLWLWSIESPLTKAIHVLYKHRWTILKPAKNFSWFTSDSPVVKLNYQSSGMYDFGGGWARSGTELFFPLSPQHLLYTQVDSRPPRRGYRLSLAKTKFIRRLMAEHSFRYIFAAERDKEVPILKPRSISRERFEQERAEWQKLNENQSAAMKEFMDKKNV